MALPQLLDRIVVKEFLMFETAAMVLLAVWALGLVTGHPAGGAIHLLLLGGLASLYLHHRAAARARARTLAGSSRMLAGAMGAPMARRPVVPAKPGQGNASRPSAAA